MPTIIFGMATGLRGGRSGVRRDFSLLQIVEALFGAHAGSISMGTGVYSLGKAAGV